MHGTKIKGSPLGGRGLFASQAFSPGAVLLSLERPLITALDKERILDTCSWCFAWTELPILSGAGVNATTNVHWCGCKQLKFCSKKCQARGWKTWHKQECKVLGAQEELVPNTVIAVMQMMNGVKSGQDSYKAILDMQTHRDDFEKAGGQKWHTMQLMANTALKMSGEKQNTFNLDPTVLAICMVLCNSVRIVTATYDPLGLALDPLLCVINHACNANAVVVFDGPQVSVRALGPIKSGEEILISYIDSSAPYGVRQAELRDQYFFRCQCTKCIQGPAATQDAFLKPPPDFDEKIKVIEDMIPQIETDPAWPRHVLGTTQRDQQLSALQFYAYSFLHGPDAVASPDDVGRLRKPIQICRNTGVWPVTRAPLPGLHQQYSVACLGANKYNEALVAMMRLHILIDPFIYPQQHHPVRVVHAWTLATLAKALSGEQDSPFCKALQSCGVDLSLLFLGLLKEIRVQVAKSHGAQSRFGKIVETTWQAMMEPGGELDLSYSQMGIRSNEWPSLLDGQLKELWPKIKAFTEDEAIAAQIDQALADS